MKILVFADAHEDLTALKALMATKAYKQADMRIFLGDIIPGFKPFANECIQLLRSDKNLVCVLGNNDSYIVNGMPPEEIEGLKKRPSKSLQVNRCLATLAEENAAWLQKRPKAFIYKNMYFCHYPWEENAQILNIVDYTEKLSPSVCDKLFEKVEESYIFFGHMHKGAFYKSNNKEYWVAGSLSQEILNLKNPEDKPEYLLIELKDEAAPKITRKTLFK